MGVGLVRMQIDSDASPAWEDGRGAADQTVLMMVMIILLPGEGGI